MRECWTGPSTRSNRKNWRFNRFLTSSIGRRFIAGDRTGPLAGSRLKQPGQSGSGNIDLGQVRQDKWWASPQKVQGGLMFLNKSYTRNLRKAYRDLRALKTKSHLQSIWCKSASLSYNSLTHSIIMLYSQSQMQISNQLTCARKTSKKDEYQNDFQMVFQLVWSTFVTILCSEFWHRLGASNTGWQDHTRNA